MMSEEIEEEKWWEEEEKLEERLRPEDREVVMLHLVIRTSEGYYNYRSLIYLIYKEPPELRYEDSYVVDLRTVEICCGVYQQYSCFDVEEIMNKLEAEGFVIKKVFEA